MRADLVRRIVLLGGPSTGKTTLAAALAARLGEPWCEEYGRTYWFEHQVEHRLSMEDLERIARAQARLERRRAERARERLVVDTCPLTTLAYARYYHGRTSAALDRAVDDYLELPRSFWLCGDEFPFDDTTDRSGPASREELQALNVEELERRGIAYRTISGPVDARASGIEEYELSQGAWR